MANVSRFDVPVKKLDIFAIFRLHAGEPDMDPAALQAHYRHRLRPHLFEINGEQDLSASPCIEAAFEISPTIQCNARREELLF